MSWINRIADSIDTIFSRVRKPLGVLPTQLLVCEIHNRPGMSAISSTANIIKRLPEANIESGVNNDESPNKVNQFIRIVCEEVIKEINDNALATCVIEPSTLNMVGMGANAGGPVVVVSMNTTAVGIKGISQ